MSAILTMIHLLAFKFNTSLGARKLTGDNLKLALGLVFNFKLGCFVTHAFAWLIQARPSLELKTVNSCVLLRLFINKKERNFLIVKAGNTN